MDTSAINKSIAIAAKPTKTKTIVKADKPTTKAKAKTKVTTDKPDIPCTVTDIPCTDTVVVVPGVVHKKRGRKPKGGKIVSAQTTDNVNTKTAPPNIIVHLKCGIEDLTNPSDNFIYDPSDMNVKIDPYQFKPVGSSGFDIETTPEVNNPTAPISSTDILNHKLKMLAHDLHTNNISDKKSACFWCTCEFDNPAIYIPKHAIKDTYHVYGCFCSPECSVGHLFQQSDIDSSTKFERYSLLNHIYGRIYNYEKNIKPAPDPNYTLDKFYGNLSIQEYRQLLKHERLLLIVDKPLMRSLPELHEDNDDFIINTQSMGEKYKLKRGIEKKTKSQLLATNFNMK